MPNQANTAQTTSTAPNATLRIISERSDPGTPEQSFDPYTPQIYTHESELPTIETLIGLKGKEGRRINSPERELILVPSSQVYRSGNGRGLDPSNIHKGIREGQINGFRLQLVQEEDITNKPAFFINLNPPTTQPHLVEAETYLSAILAEGQYHLVTAQKPEYLITSPLDPGPDPGELIGFSAIPAREIRTPQQAQSILERYVLPTTDFTDIYSLRRDIYAQDFGINSRLVAEDMGAILARADWIRTAQDHGGKWDHQPMIAQAVAEHLISHPEDDFLYVEAATGTGKTRIQAKLYKEWIDEGYQVIHVTPYINLLRQSHREFEDILGLEENEIARWYGQAKDEITTDTGLIVTTYRSLPQLLQKADAAIVSLDEGHHIAQGSSWMLDDHTLQRAVKIAWSATCEADPFYLSKVGAKEVFTFGLPEATAREVTSPIRFHLLHYTPAQEIDEMIQDILQKQGNLTSRELKLICDDASYIDTVADLAIHDFVDRESEDTPQLEETIFEAFNQKDALHMKEALLEKGEFDEVTEQQIAVVCSDMGEAHNQEIFNKIAHGEVKWVIAVNMMIEGIDWPSCQNICMRPRSSTREMVQAMGRSLRYQPDKIADVYQFSPDEEPERLFATVRSYLDLPIIDPDVIYKGNRREYLEGARGNRHQRHVSQIWRIDSSMHPIDSIWAVPGDMPVYDVEDWNRVRTLEDLESYMIIHAAKKRDYPEPIRLQSFEDDSSTKHTRWHIHNNRFYSAFQISLDRVRERFPYTTEDKLIETISRVEEQLGINSVRNIYQDPQTLLRFTQDRIITGDLLACRQMARQRIKDAYYFPVEAVDTLIAEWADQGRIPAEVNTVKLFIKYAGLLNAAAEIELNFPQDHFTLPFDLSSFPSVMEILRGTRHAAVAHTARAIQRFYSENGFYIRPPKYGSASESMRVYGFNAQKVRDAFVRLRNIARTVVAHMDDEKRDDFPFDTPAIRTMQEIIEAAEFEATTNMGVTITPDPFEDLGDIEACRNAVNYMIRRAQLYVDSGGSFADIQIGTGASNDDILLEIFGVKAGRFKDICTAILDSGVISEFSETVAYESPDKAGAGTYRTNAAIDSIHEWDNSPTGILALIAAAADDTFRLSYYIYHRLPTLEMIVAELADFISDNPVYQNREYGELGRKTYHAYGPPFLNGKTCGLLHYNPERRMRTTGLREFCKSFSVTTSEFIHMIKAQMEDSIQ
jgi:superfamily II DNA or RNA helicase